MTGSRRRLLPFDGNDEEYIAYLERELLKARQKQSAPSETAIPSRSENANGLRFLYYDPSQEEFGGGSPTAFTQCRDSKACGGCEDPKKQWEKEMDSFLRDIGSVKDWMDKRTVYHLNTAEDNGQAVTILLGRMGSVELKAKQQEGPPLLQNDNKDLIMRGCDYGARANISVGHGKRMVLLGKFQELIFVSYCEVMIYVGTSRETVDWMMRRYISDSTSKNLERIRTGSVWVNRCVAQLLAQSWGYASWEIFLLSNP
ncbi:hypothetical protein BJX96DRAFT_176225 [Aspergillus floccosus]